MKFEDLWAAYPEEDFPCLDAIGEPAFENQCAIRMGTTLAAAGIDLSSFGGSTCWHNHGNAHTLRAEELSAWLDETVGPWAPTETHDGAIADTFSGRQGIILCRNFWGTGNQGDHIDLWNGSAMRHGAAEYIDRSEQVLFWEVR
ncbi:type VI secretion system amidase effector protein Tae4 [Sphingomonas sp. BK069]|uniref:type VI secretion system amidase effector protein Tae4 n=1 Tax=Sphingomonas sp. BK069 TaxID=2586979 RepID=UPI00161625A7|nr:type VI secretion system amidase effector protein Tae4 [Sphingomonas sp. BK069]MBB3348348.1 hypothetical protein [Sphingomonas sp. BK069]